LFKPFWGMIFILRTIFYKLSNNSQFRVVLILFNWYITKPLNTIYMIVIFYATVLYFYYYYFSYSVFLTNKDSYISHYAVCISSHTCSHYAVCISSHMLTLCSMHLIGSATSKVNLHFEIITLHFNFNVLCN